MRLIALLLNSIEWIFVIYFFYVVAYNLVLSIAGKFKLKLKKSDSPKLNKIAVMIPAYREDSVIISSAKAALEQDYPHSAYDVVVIADGLQEQTIQTLKQIPVQVITVVFEKSTKVKSLNRAMAQLGEGYDMAVVLDADNVMSENFLSTMNQFFNAGYQCVQGERKPKNYNSKLAILDGLSEGINSHINLNGSCILGGAAPVVGSGFAIKYDAFKKIMAGLDAIGGFDKELCIQLLQNGIRTMYAPEVFVYDEKVSKSEVFVNQRKRWIASQYFYLRQHLGIGMNALFTGHFSLFNTAILRSVQLPRLLNLGLLFIITLLAFLLRSFLFFPFWIWPVFLGLNIFSLMLAAPPHIYSLNALRAISTLPKTFLQMFFLMFKLKGGANKKFIHTPHGAETNK